MDQATTIDIPKKPEPVVTRYSAPVCRCKKCGKHVRGQAPGLAPDQAGATAHRVGPEVMAAAHELHYGTGIPVRKVPEVLKTLTGVEVTASAITQNAMKQSEGEVGAAYEKLRGEMREYSGGAYRRHRLEDWRQERISDGLRFGSGGGISDPVSPSESRSAGDHSD